MDLPAFATLVHAHGDELLAHARTLVDTDDAEDVLHDAFVRALRAYPSLSHARGLRAWLYRIVTTTAYDHHRSRRLTPSDAVPQTASHDDPEDSFDELIGSASPAQQLVLRLRFVEDLDHAQIAAHLGCSVPAARQRLRHALNALRPLLTHAAP